jgi:hypothetical protein
MPLRDRSTIMQTFGLTHDTELPPAKLPATDALAHTCPFHTVTTAEAAPVASAPNATHDVVARQSMAWGR